MTSDAPKKSNRDAVLDSLVATFPALRDALPLAIGIHKTILERLPELTKVQVSKAMRIHTTSTRYLKSMAKAEQRFDLDGNPAGEVTAEQREAAVKLVKERINRANERKKAEEELRKAEEQAKQQKEKLEKLAAKFNSR
ncbi:MAG: ProQ/FinO family protein [Gallionellaceae bacterium]|nr:ProQ/FinO family protein [Gallionellaceae bacterium]